MSLGKKLAGYRKLAGLTQQQLGEELNLSPQAISKWENDLAEPDLATLRILSELYKVPIGEMIDPNIGVSEPVLEKSEEEAEKDSAPEIIGFCKKCGIVVNENNVGERSPEILCLSCRDKRDKEAQEAKEAEERKQIKTRTENRSRHLKRLIFSMITAGLAALIFLPLIISFIVITGSVSLIPIAIVGPYVVFSYVACLFYDCFIQDLLFDNIGRSFQLPFILITTFDLDGIIWLIGMKIIFWALGVLLGLIYLAFCIALGIICAPFVFPFVMISVSRAIKHGAESEYVL